MSSSQPVSPLTMWLDFWHQRDKIIACRRLGATPAGYVEDQYHRGNYLCLGELLVRWQQGDLLQRCPKCGKDAFTIYQSRVLGFVPTSSCLCTHCESIVNMFAGREAEFNHDMDAFPTEGDPIASCEITLEQVWLALSGVEVRNKVRGPHGTLVAQYDPVERVMEDAAGVRLGSWDGSCFRTTDNAVVAERAGNILRLATSDGALRDAFELDTVSDTLCYLESGVTYLPIRYRAQPPTLVTGDGSDCLSMEGLIPYDLLVAIAEDVIPGVEIDAGDEPHQGEDR